MKSKPWYLFMMYTILCEILTILWVVSTPSDIENQFLMGFSLNRLALLIFVLLCSLTSLILLYISLSKKGFYLTISRLFESPSDAVSYTLFLISILMAGLFILSFTHVFPNRFFMARLQPVLLMLFLISFGYTMFTALAINLD